MTELDKKESWGDYFKRYWGHTAFILGWLLRIIAPFGVLFNEWIGITLYLLGVGFWFAWVVSVIIWIWEKVRPKSPQSDFINKTGTPEPKKNT